MEIDIRTVGPTEEITVVRFADTEFDNTYGQVDIVRRGPAMAGIGIVELVESDNGDYVRIYSAEHARNLIAALDYAIDNSWIK